MNIERKIPAMSDINPYQSPTTPVVPMEDQPDATARLYEAAQLLAQTGPWVRFLSVMSFDMLEDAWFVTAANPTEEFSAAYDAFSGEEARGFVPHAYDCMTMFAKGFDKAGEDPDGVMAYISALQDYDGAVGKLSYNAGSIESPAVKKIVKGGSFVLDE